MLSGEGNENGEKKTIGSISKKATFHVESGCSSLFFVNFFAAVLHDYNVKLQETFWLHVFWRKCRTLIFNLVPASFSHFLTAATNFSCCSSSKKCLLCFFISRSSSLSPFFSPPALSFAGLSPTFSFSLSFSVSIFQICEHDN